MRRILILIGIAVLVLTSQVYALDGPHNETNDISCFDCHLGGQAAVDPNTVCLGCHTTDTPPYSKSGAPLVATHSGTSHGTFEKQCTDCHYFHFYNQHYMWGSNTYLVTGTISSITDNGDGTITFGYTNLTVNSSNWSNPSTWSQKTGTERGLIMIPNTKDLSFGFEIINADSATITVKGSIAPFQTRVHVGDTFALIYGQAINSFIPNWTQPRVKFYEKEGQHGFAHNDFLVPDQNGDGVAEDSTPDGVCQVCHTLTNYWRSDGTLAATDVHSSQNGTDCTQCHKHSDGFRPSGGACNSCHGYPPTSNTYTGGPDGLATPATGSDSAGKHDFHVNTFGASCNTCHTGYSMPDNTNHAIEIGFSIFGLTGGSYDGQTNVNYVGTNGTSVSNTGTRSCSNIYCHSNVQGQTDGTGGPTIYGSPTWLETATVQCGDCHNADGVQGNGTTMSSGSHTKHLSVGKQCSDCHNGAGYGTSKHVDYNIDIAFQTDAFGNTGSYSQSPNTPGNGYGSCSTVYCHSSVQADGGVNQPTLYRSPTWGGIVSCGDCHAIPPATGKHSLHYNLELTTCSTCHNGYGPSVNPNAHANGNIDLALDPTTVGGSYSQEGAGNNPPGNGYGSCSNVYCHSDVQADGGNAGPTIYQTPNWGDATIACDSCHGTAGHGNGQPATGSHETHVNGNGLSCNECHNGFGHNTTKHANKTIDIAFLQGGTYSQGSHTPGSGGYGTCSSTYCHGTGTPTWGAAGSVQCGDCHAVNNTLAGRHSTHYASATNASTTDRTTAANNSTQTAYVFSCAVCHNGATHAGGPAPNATNQVAEVAFDATVAGNGSYTEGTSVNNDPNGFNYTDGSCSSLYCHSDGNGGAPNVAVNWGMSAGTLDCTGCHNYTAASGTPMASGSHTAHINDGTVIPNQSCNVCHTSTTDGTAIIDKSLHVNHTKDVTIISTLDSDTDPTNNYSGGVCSNLYCHSNGTSLTAPFGTPNQNLVWGTDTATCSSCHDGTTTGPSYTNGTPKANSHDKHVVQKGYKCNDCHANTVDASNNISNTANHINKQYDVAGTNIGSYTYATDGGTCSNVVCHSSLQSADGSTTTPYQYGSPKWGDPTTAACGTCHPTSVASGLTTGSHSAHLNSSVVNGCGDCHTGAANDASSYNSTNHQNLLIDVANGYTAGGTPGNGYGTCSTATCHGGGGTRTVNSPAWGTDFTGKDSCTRCHGTPTTAPAPDYAKAPPNGIGGETAETDPHVGVHQSHLNQASRNGGFQFSSDIACSECHNVPSAVESTGHLYDGTNDTTLGQAEVPLNGTLATANGATPAYDPSTGTCSNVYCHGAKMPNGSTNGSDPTPVWNNTAYLTGTPSQTGDCGQCHGAPPNTSTHTGSETLDQCGNCHTNWDNVNHVFKNPAEHINGTFEQPNLNCNGCHSYPPSTGAHAVHVQNIQNSYEPNDGVWAYNPNDTLSNWGPTNHEVCAVCHDMTNTANHTDTADHISPTGYPFDAGTAPAYDTTTKTCSNISCHFGTSPKWTQ